MEFEKITFDESRNVINEILGYKLKESYNLTPNEIFRVAKETGTTLERKYISEWGAFESENGDYSTMKLLNETKIELNSEDPLIIISDECFQEQKAYKIRSKELLEFAEEVYPKIHAMDFIQPLDLILIQPLTRKILMIHHEGIIMEY